MNIDWSKAPDGATHCLSGRDFFKLDNDVRVVLFINGSTHNTLNHIGDFLSTSIVERPKNENKVSAINWDLAPEDATHAGTTKGVQFPVFYKDIREDKYSYWYADGDGWREDAKGHPACTPLIKRPKKQEAWNGEGLPPVGTVCDMHIDDFGWITGTVVVHIDLDEPTEVAHNGEEVFHGNASDFRPIKTAEQLAEEEREDAANKMFQRFGGIGGLTKKQCIWVVSEGYRKQ